MLSRDSTQIDRQRQRELGRELDRLRKIQAASEGHKVLSRNESLKNSYRVFRDNYKDLRYFLDHISSPAVDVQLWAEAHRYRLDYAEQQVARLLHNYLAAAFSLVDTTRVFMNEHYEGTGFCEEYEERVRKDFAEAPLHRFMQKLRTYTMHYRLPALTPRFSFKRREDGGMDYDSGFWLNVDKLREWKDWTGKAREYLEGLESTVKLTDIIDAYDPVVTAFHRWLSVRLQEVHSQAIEDLFDLERHMMEVEREWRKVSNVNDPSAQEPPPESRRKSLDSVYEEEDESDFGTIDGLLATLYVTLTFPPGGLPNLDRYRSLFLPNAQIVYVEREGTFLSSIDDQISDFHVALRDGKITAMTETEAGRDVDRVGDVARVLSYYETHSLEEGSEKRRRGLYDFHLIKAGDRWAISSLHICEGYGIRIDQDPGHATEQAGVGPKNEVPGTVTQGEEPQSDCDHPYG